MNREMLPIGSVIEVNNKTKLIVIGYEDVLKEKITYICAAYPSYLMMDFIPFKKLKEYKEKYGDYNTDTSINHDSEYTVIHEGYKNNEYYEILKRIEGN